MERSGQTNVPGRSGRWTAAGLALIALLAAVAYAGSFRAPFIFDDIAAVRGNASIRAWWDLKAVFSPPDGLSVSGRPVANFSLAVSHALSGERPWGYHAVNFAVHLAAGAALFGVARRMLRRPVLAGRFGGAADELALALAALWVLHPLQTATVTYVMQRTEGLMGLCFLATLYFFERGVSAEKPGRWLTLAMLVCAVGMGCKEAMAAAPFVVWLYDRTFVAGSFGAAWRQRKFFHLALAATWLGLAALVLGTDNRAGSAGWNAGMSPVAYVLTQAGAIGRYLGLAVWPAPLVFDYGTALTVNAPALVAVSALVVGTGIALWRWPVVGFCGAFFFAVLAPTSSIVPIATQTMAEHRMYLPLAVLLALAVMGVFAGWGKKTLWLWPIVALAGAAATGVRNHDYRSERSIWGDTVAKRPGNARAHFNLGVALNADGDTVGAERAWLETVRIEPRHEPAHAKLGEALAQSGRAGEALGHFEAAAGAGKASGSLLNNWGSALLAEGRAAEALGKFEAAQGLLPLAAEVRFNAGNALVALGRGVEAMEFFREAVRLRPGYEEAHYNLGAALAFAGRYAEALVEFESALRLAPTDAAAQRNVAALRAYLGK